MACFRKNRTIRSDYVPGTGGFLRIFIRIAGTSVSQSQSSDAGYIADESAICVQWDGEPTYDSGYSTAMFPVTMRGLKEAHKWLDSWQETIRRE